MVLLLFLSGGGLLFWSLWWSPAPPAVPTGPDGTTGPGPESTGEVAPIGADRSPVDTGGDRSPNATGPQGVAITVLAEATGSARPLPGFSLTLVNLASPGAQPQITEVVSDRHLMYLLPGRYELTARRSGFSAPPKQTLTITRATTPTDLRLQFQAIDAFAEITVLDQGTKQPLAVFRATVRTHRPGSERPRVDFLPESKCGPSQP